MELSENSPNRKRPLKAAIEKGSTASLSQLAVGSKMTVLGGCSMNKVIEAVSELRRLEDRFGVTIFSRGLPYGGHTMVIRDDETGEVYDLYDLEEIESETFLMEGIKSEKTTRLS